MNDNIKKYLALAFLASFVLTVFCFFSKYKNSPLNLDFGQDTSSFGDVPVASNEVGFVDGEDVDIEYFESFKDNLEGVADTSEPTGTDEEEVAPQDISVSLNGGDVTPEDLLNNIDKYKTGGTITVAHAVVETRLNKCLFGKTVVVLAVDGAEAYKESNPDYTYEQTHVLFAFEDDTEIADALYSGERITLKCDASKLFAKSIKRTSDMPVLTGTFKMD